MTGPHTTSTARRAAGHPVPRHGGFTVVELIITLILVGIIATIAIGRFFERTAFDVDAWNEQVRAILRYGQKTAIAQNRPVTVLLTQDRIALCFQPTAACAAADQVLAPGGANNDSAATRAACASDTWMCAGRPQGVTMTVPAFNLRFDALGRAAADNGAAGAMTVTIGGDGRTRTITVEGETGYVN